MTTERDLIQRLAHELYKYEYLTSRCPPDYIPAPSPLVAFARAVLARCGRPATEQPEPEELTDEEILNLSQEHQVSYTTLNGGVIYPLQEGADMRDDVLSFARALIAADRARWGRPAIEPVPVSDRPWERKGWCDNNDWCWGFNADDTDPCWIFDHMCWGGPGCWTHMLPHYALPVPTPTTQENN